MAGQFNPVPTYTGLYGVKAVAAGLSASFALRPDGSVWAWGDSSYGQLGDGTGTSHPDSRLIPGLSGVAAIAAGGYHTLALKNDGSVLAWGANDYGELGDGTTVKHATPTPTNVPAGITAIAAGLEHSLALKNDGTVYAWGWNVNGQLGDGSTTNRATPVLVPGLSNVIAIAAGANHSLALKNDGSVWAWGYNAHGELGDGTLIDRRSPVQVSGTGGSGLFNAIANPNSILVQPKIAAGSNHSFVLKSDGTVWAWGSNVHGQLGDGKSVDRSTPGQVLGLNGVTSVVGGGAGHSTSVMADGTLRVWGWNAYQTLGDGTNADRLVPVEVVGREGDFFAMPRTPGTPDPFQFASRFGLAPGLSVTSNPITVGGTSTGSSIAIIGGQYSINNSAYTSAPGTVNGGDMVKVQLNAPASYAATAVATLTIGGISGSFYVVTKRDPTAADVTQAVAAGNYHTLLMRPNGTVWGFGYNGNGQLANGTTLSRSAPEPLSRLTNIQQIAAGQYHTLALKADGALWASGWNGAGQIGDGTAGASRLAPVQVIGLPSTVIAMAAGHAHSLAVDSNGNVWAWGANGDGQLGNGTTTPSFAPVQVPGLVNVIAVAAGDRHSIALTVNGTLWAWGNNDLGQLGDGTLQSHSAPIQVALGGVAKIAAGAAHTLALRSDGSVWAWGANTFGQLGNGTNTSQGLPLLVPGLEARVTAIAAGQGHSIAIKAGQLYVWGNNGNGEVGDGTTNNALVPYAVPNLTSIVAIAGGTAHTVALSTIGVLYAFGDNTFGQVGNRSGNYRVQSALLNLLRGDLPISQLAIYQTTQVGTPSQTGSAAIDTTGLVTSLNFGPLAVGTTSAAQTVIVPNQTAAPFTTLSLSVTPEFTIQSTTCAPPLPGGTSCTVDVTHTPAAPGARSGELAVTASDGSTAPQVKTVTLNGTATVVGVAVMLGPSALDFGNQSVGTTSAQQSVTLANNGSTTLNVSSIAINGTDATQFVRTHNCPASLASAANCVISVTFAPGSTGTKSALLSVTSNAPGSPHSVSLGGNGVVDTQAPSIPAALTATAVSGAQINLAWATSTDNVGVIAYQVYRGGVFRTTVNAPTLNFSDSGLTASTSYNYKVAACDAAGNCSAQSAQASATTLAPGQVAYSPKLEIGFNLGSNALNITLNVPALFGNQDTPVNGVTSNIVSLWKWNAVDQRWAFYSPQLSAAGNAAYAASHNFDALSAVSPGEGFWMNAINPITLAAQSGTTFTWNNGNFSALPSGFNLLAAANSVTPSEFNNNVSAAPPSPGVIPTDNFVSLWAWDAVAGKWYFYSPLLESAGGLPAVKAYADSHNYLHFQDAGKTLGIGTGFWVNRP
jgi:alpha-tubulin suppressor-like RCC1 family protein